MKTTIITGHSRGIGKAIAQDLSDLNHNFIFLSSKQADFEDYYDVYCLVKEQLQNSKSTQINIILCAAQIGDGGSILNLTECEKLYKINVLGNLAVIKAASTLKVKMRIVWFAGGGAAFPMPEFMGYALSKVATVRAVENLSLTLKDTCIIALAPGAVDTDMLKKTIEAGCTVRTKTDISEPVAFVRKFLLDDSIKFNGMFLHVRDTLNIEGKNIFKLRRTE